MSHNRKIAIIGLGYVGLPVVVEFGKSSSVVGFDIDEQRVADLNDGRDLTNAVSPADLGTADGYPNTTSPDSCSCPEPNFNSQI